MKFNLPNDERMHHYQRGRTSITGLRLWLRKIIETGRLVVVVMTRLVLLLISVSWRFEYPVRVFNDLNRSALEVILIRIVPS